jgi:predicted DCC family thiol-disulfide oxidoreductase YuxK
VRILRNFGPGWKFVALLVAIIPRFIRDPLYRWIARHRYRMFGRRAACRVPTADIADRFLH